MKFEHPYRKLESLEVWEVVQKAIKDLRDNGDLVETTAAPYIVGYLVEQLVSSGLLADTTPPVKRRSSR
jgi:hypothetical protein